MIYHLGRQWKDHGYIPFSEDFAQIAYNNGTVLYAALELAVYMGFKEIYLLGVDASGLMENMIHINIFMKKVILLEYVFQIRFMFLMLALKDLRISIVLIYIMLHEVGNLKFLKE